MPAGYDVFNNTRINAVFQGIMDPRLLPGRLLFSERVPTVKALETEITARFIQYPQIADLIADDSRAVVYQTGKFELMTNKVPNLKIGANMTQSMLNQLLQIQGNAGAPDFFTDWENLTLLNLRIGLAQRVEVLLAAMMTDSFVYDRLGMKISASWRMPSPLNITVSVAWDHTVTVSGVIHYDATPITDILTLRRLARVAYGIEYNRITMSLAAFNYMIATDEFQARAKTFIPIGFAIGGAGQAGQYAQQNTEQMKSFASRILDGMEIVLYDQMFWSQNEAGTPSMFPFLPITKVVVDNSSNDKNRQVWDFANTTVIEAMVASLGGRPIGARDASGPLSYVTFPENLNPPNVTYWAVQRGFPRKHMLQANACLTVGSFTDPIAATVPF